MSMIEDAVQEGNAHPRLAIVITAASSLKRNFRSWADLSSESQIYDLQPRFDMGLTNFEG